MRQRASKQPPITDNPDTEATPPASTGEALDFVWRSFDNLNQWVRFADAKAAVLLAASGAISGSLVSLVSNSKTELLHSPWTLLWITGIVILTFYAACNALGSLMPQLSIGRKGVEPPTNEESSSLVFFMDIAQRFPTASAFHERMTTALKEPEAAVTQIAYQVWANSKVATTKYKRIAKAVFGLTLAVCLGFIGVLILLINLLVLSIAK